MELQPSLNDHNYQIHLADGGVQYINGEIHQLLIHIDTYVEKLNFHVMNLRSTYVILRYPRFFNTNSSLSIDWVNHSISFSLNNSQHFIQCVKSSFVSTLSSTHFFDSSSSTLYYCVLDTDIQIYNISIKGDQLTYYEHKYLNHSSKSFKMSSLRNY